MIQRALWLGLSLVLLLLPGSASAFSDYELFPLAPLEGGGGGGRYFTTSPLDGYGCAVCHTGGVKPVVFLRGLPDSEFVPGTVYDVELTWQFPQEPHSLNLEIVNARGEPTGTMMLPEALEPADRCTDGTTDPAVRFIEEAQPRRILWLGQCGATRVRFRYVAPEDFELHVAFSMVRADRSEKPEGDGVTEVRRVLRRQGFAMKQAASCALSPSTARSNSLRWLAPLLGLLCALRRRRC